MVVAAIVEVFFFFFGGGGAMGFDFGMSFDCMLDWF